MLTDRMGFDNKKTSPPGETGGEPCHGEAAPDHITYQKHKLSFFPLRKHSKKPLSKWAVYQTRWPTEDEIKAWQDKGLLDQVAIVCGAVSGIIVLDIDDPEKFEAWLKKEKHSLPPTPRVNTSEGRCHYYFKHPGGKIKNSVKKIPGADIKADGGYVVAPPSIHPSGHAYEWNEFLSLSDLEPEELPEWLFDYIEREASQQVSVSNGDLLPPDEDWVATALRGVSKGERNNTAIKLAGYYIGRGEPEPRVLEMLLAWNLRNSEPLSEKAIAKVVTSAARMEARKRIKAAALEGRIEAESGCNGDLSGEEQRQAAMQGLGERLGLPLTNIRGTKSEESVFEFFMGEADSVMVTGDQLAEQRLFKKRFINAGLIVPQKVPEPRGGGAWDGVVRQIIRLAVLQDIGAESTALGELREFINDFIENYRGFNFFLPGQSIPSHVTFFVVQRKGERPKLYCRVAELFHETKALGYKSIRKLTIMLPSLGHKPERFSWNRCTVRAWVMNLDNMSPGVREMVWQKVKEKMEDMEDDNRNCLQYPGDADDGKDDA
jgi:hypothetical protein